MAMLPDVLTRLGWIRDGKHIAVAIWSEDDVLDRAEERGIPCTEEQAQEIVDSMDSRQDCSIGITWDTIDCYLEEL